LELKSHYSNEIYENCVRASTPSEEGFSLIRQHPYKCPAVTLTGIHTKLYLSYNKTD